MASWIYVGTNPPVGAAGTQSLLTGHAAIWAPPPGLLPWPATHPQPGEKIWLVWRDDANPGTILLLGGGRVMAPPQGMYNTAILWTDPQHPGMRTAAEALNYGGGTGMSFIRLTKIVLPPGGAHPVVTGLGAVNGGVNEASPADEAILQAPLSIP